MTKEQVHAYWKRDNNIKGYLDTDITKPRTDYLVEKVRRIVKGKKNSILEICCGPGRNLNALHREDYENLYGIDINTDAIALMGRTYTEMYNRSIIKGGSIEEILPEFEDEGIDFIISFAGLLHIHPDSKCVFDEVKRIAKRGILIVELDGKFDTINAYRIWQRDYNKIFRDDKWKLKESESLKNKCDPTMEKYKFFYFQRKKMNNYSKTKITKNIEAYETQNSRQEFLREMGT